MNIYKLLNKAINYKKSYNMMDFLMKRFHIKKVVISIITYKTFKVYPIKSLNLIKKINLMIVDIFIFRV